MKNSSFYTLAFTAAMSLPAIAQQQHLHVGCGTTNSDQYAIRERMFENRLNRERLMERLQFRNGIIYIPIQFHLVSSNGTDYHPIQEVYNLLCRINDDVADLNMNIRFYMYGPVSYIQNPQLYNHEQTSSDPMAQYLMGLYKVQNITNIFIGRAGQSGDSFGAYYTSSVDIIYTFKDDVNGNSSALTHELGHYFTLAHTFFGWEGTDYATEAIGGKAPELVGGVAVEKTARPGQGLHENCQWAADGFCGTPADYTRAWNNCNFTGTMFDQDSVPIAPQETNIMSYFPRFCMDTFTLDQQDAMMTDILARGYDMFPDPQSMAVTGKPTLLYPTASTPVMYPELVEFRWEAAPGAIRYLVVVDKTFSGVPIENIITREVDGTSTWVQLEPNKTFSWSVYPITDIDVCNGFISDPETFTSLDWTTGTSPLASSSVLDWKVFPNPSSVGDQVNMEINCKMAGEATLSLYNAVGQQVMRPQTILLSQGNNLQHLSTNMLEEGFYMLVLESKEGKLMQKLALKR